MLTIMVNPPSSSNPTKSGWLDLINESIHTSDDIDIGDIDAVSRDFVVVKRGFVNVHYYYIPITKVEGWDSHVLWLRITENEVKANYERDKIPDPSRYYVKDYPTYTAEYYPELIMIPPRYIQPVFGTTVPPYSPRTEETTKAEPSIQDAYVCDLCNTSFKTEEELSNHVGSQY